MTVLTKWNLARGTIDELTIATRTLIILLLMRLIFIMIQMFFLNAKIKSFRKGIHADFIHSSIFMYVITYILIDMSVSVS